MVKDTLEESRVLLSVFDTSSQHHRLLRMAFPHDDGPAHTTMLVNAIEMKEALSRDFRLEAEILSDDAHIPLTSMMARMVTITLVREDGSVRHMNGYVSAFRCVRTDGGFARYAMVLEPWLAFARLRSDNISFHHRSVIELTETTFARYRQHDWRLRLSRDYVDKKLTCANQHNETDYNHLHRRWEDAGLHYHYEHRADGHTLILCDHSAQAEAIDDTTIGGAAGYMCFHADSGSAEADGIHDWQAVRQLGPGVVTLSSFNYKRPHPQLASGYALGQQGEVASDEIYENTGAYGFADVREGEARAQRRMEELDQRRQYVEGAGNHRAAQPGRTFKLAGHFSTGKAGADAGERDYLIISVCHGASNNYPAGAEAKSTYRNTFMCIDRDIRWRPGRGYNSVPCADPGVQTALVVGPAGEAVYTDELGRIKLQFHWDRLGTFDQASSPWIRVMAPMAGQYFGQLCLPRIGQEVVVQFLDGNIDRPIVVGLVYNREQMPPWRLPAQRALTGLRSRELGGEGNNHLILDDTLGAMQAQLKSDHACSQLSLGSIHRIVTSEGRLDARGEGWELATNAWGVARANRGMLITTEARPDAASHAKDMGETWQRLDAAQRQHALLATLAVQAGAQDGQGQQEAAKAIAQQNDDINGGAAGAAGKPAFPQLAAPHLLLASPAGMAATSKGSMHLASEQHVALSAGQDVSIATGGSLFASVRQALRLFVHKLGIRLVAAAGDVDLRALSDSINLLAKLNITQTANRITISAREEVLINGGGSYAKFTAAGIEQGSNGTFVAHAASHSFSGAKNMDMAITMPAPGKLDGEGAFHLGSHAAAGGRSNAGMPFKLYRDDALLEEGCFDEAGNMLFKHALDQACHYRITLANGDRYVIKPHAGQELHEASAGVGYHGYDNPGGSVNDEHATLTQDRLHANPALARGHT